MPLLGLLGALPTTAMATNLTSNAAPAAAVNGTDKVAAFKLKAGLAQMLKGTRAAGRPNGSALEAIRR